MMTELVFVGQCSETVNETHRGGIVLNEDNLSRDWTCDGILRQAMKRTYVVSLFESSFCRGGVRRDVESLGAEMSRGCCTSLMLD